MKHPQREAWVPYLCGEAKPEVRRELRTHLKHCAECRAELAVWEQTLQRLDAWKLPRLRSRYPAALPVLPWAVAAAVLLVAGFVGGHLLTTRHNLQAAPTVLEPRMRQEITRLVRQEIDKAAAQTLARAALQTSNALSAFAAAFQSDRDLEQKNFQSALVVLKGQLDTVAMNTDAGFRQAEHKLVQLADYKLPKNPEVGH